MRRGGCRNARHPPFLRLPADHTDASRRSAVRSDSAICVRPGFADSALGNVELSQFLDAQGIAVRVGHHCAAPLHRQFGMTASVRASTALYNTEDDVDLFLDAVRGIRGFFGVTDQAEGAHA